MKKEGLDLRADGDWLYAEGTSLGGDDGIAVAYMLAILDSDSIAHPRMEAVITVEEETGMDGARAIDLSICKGKRMLNLDSEEEGIFLTSCAGGRESMAFCPPRGRRRKAFAIGFPSRGCRAAIPEERSTRREEIPTVSPGDSYTWHVGKPGPVWSLRRADWRTTRSPDRPGSAWWWSPQTRNASMRC